MGVDAREQWMGGREGELRFTDSTDDASGSVCFLLLVFCCKGVRKKLRLVDRNMS